MTPKGLIWVLNGNDFKHLKGGCDANCCWQASLSAAASTPFSLLWEELTLNLVLIRFQFRKCYTPQTLYQIFKPLNKLLTNCLTYNIETSKLNCRHKIIWKWRKWNKVNDINQPTHQSNRAVKGTFSDIKFSRLQKLVFFSGILGQTRPRDPPSPLWLRESKNEPI